MAVTLRIERLVLDGVALPHRERTRLQAALEAGLAEMIEVGGLSPALLAGGALPSLPAGQLAATARAGQDGAALGARAGRGHL